jgi:hypothetical protein
MHTRGLILWLILSFYQSDGIFAEQEANGDRYKSRDNLKSTYSANDLLYSDNSMNTCSIDDFACLAMAANDKLGLDAIKTLHQKLDDDANGNVDLTESDDVSPSRIHQSATRTCFLVFKRRVTIRLRI